MTSDSSSDDRDDDARALSFEKPPLSLSSTLPPGSFEQVTRLGVVCLLGVTLAMFAQGLFGTFVWGDVPLILQNRNVRDAHVLQALGSQFWDVSSGVAGGAGYYRPLVTLSYVLEWRLYGDRPFGYHFTNLLLHLACVALVFHWLFARLSREIAGERAWQALAGAMAGALFFAVHPSRVEVVSWISGRSDAMMTLFSLAGLLWFERARGKLRGVVTGAAFVLALACKESMVTLPVCLVLEVLLRERSGLRRVALRDAAIALGMTLGAVLFRVLLVPLPHSSLDAIFAQPVARVLSSLGHYVMCVVWPARPSLLTALQNYDASGQIAYSNDSIALGTATLLLLCGFAWLASRSERVRPWLADALWFFVPLLPVLNLLPLTLKALVANRFLYLPLLGVVAVVARAVPAGFARGGVRSALTLLTVVALFVGCAFFTTRYLPAFASDEASIRYERTLHPDSTWLLEELAERQAARGQTDAALHTALDGYRAAERLRERTPRIRFMLLAAHLLGDRLHDFQALELGELAEFYAALERGERAQLDVPPLRIGFALSTQDRASVLADIDEYVVPRAMIDARVGRVDDAIAGLARAVQDQPRAAVGLRALALLLAREERYVAAGATLARAEAAAPSHPDTAALRQHMADAHELFTRSTRSATEAAVARAHAYLVLAAPGRAARTIDQALAALPNDLTLIATRARIDAIDGNFSAARARLGAARSTFPNAAPDLEAVEREIDAVEQGEAPATPAAATR